MRRAFLGYFLAWATLIGSCDHRDDGEGSAAGSSGPDASTDYVCTGDIDDLQRDIFSVGCAYFGCHGADSPVYGLELESPNVADRLVGVRGNYCGVPLVVPGDPDSSLLYEKLTQEFPSCGSRMPPPDFIPFAPPHTWMGPSHTDCLRAWIQSLD